MNRRNFIQFIVASAVAVTGWLPAYAAGRRKTLGDLWYVDDRKDLIHVGPILKNGRLSHPNRTGMGSNLLVAESCHGNFPPFLKEAEFVVTNGKFAKTGDRRKNTRRLTGCCVRILKTGRSVSRSPIRTIQVVVNLPAGVHASPLGHDS